MNLRDLLDSDSAEEKTAPPAGPRAEAAMMDLRAACARYLAPCPFAPGDLVTPRRGYSVRWAGYPGVVLEVIARPATPPAIGEEGSSASGRRFDLRVLVCTPDGKKASFWVESFEFERYELQGE